MNSTYINKRPYPTLLKFTNQSNYHLITGLPASGKTTVLSELCKILAGDLSQRVLLTTSTELGVDSLIEAVLRTKSKKLNITRVGSSHKTSSDSDLNFDNQLKRRLSFQPEYKKLKRELKAILNKMDIVKGTNFNKRKRLEELKDRSNDIASQLSEFERIATENILNESNVIAATLGTVNDKILRTYFGPGSSSKKLFDVVLIDDAQNGLDAQTFMGIISGRRVIMAGDPKQLLTDYNAAVDESSATRLFSRLLTHYNNLENSDDYLTVLPNQYRMKPEILDISSSYHYKEMLFITESNNDQVLKKPVHIEIANEDTNANRFIQIPVKEKRETGVDEHSIHLNHPIAVIDTSTFGFEEQDKHLDESSLFHKSKCNLGEAELAVFIAATLIYDHGISANEIGIVTSYSAQVDIINHRVNELVLEGKLRGGIEVGTPDDFQGRSKDIIIFSAVRSNNKREIGYLRNSTRLNVAVTRARKFLCLIGDASTINHSEFIAHWLKCIVKSGIHYQPTNFHLSQVNGIMFNYDDFAVSKAQRDIELAQKNARKQGADKEPKSERRISNCEGQNRQRSLSKPRVNNLGTKMTDSNTSEVYNYFKEIIDDFLKSGFSTISIFRKLDAKEQNILMKICETSSINFIKLKKHVVLENPEVPKVLNDSDFIVVSERENTESFIDISDEPIRTQKRGVNRKKKINVIETELRVKNDELSEVLHQRALERCYVCFGHSNASGYLCRKNVNQNSPVCQLCMNKFCEDHLLASFHDCAGLQEEQRISGITPLTPEELTFIEEKVREKLLDAIFQRQPKLKLRNL